MPPVSLETGDFFRNAQRHWRTLAAQSAPGKAWGRLRRQTFAAPPPEQPDAPPSEGSGRDRRPFRPSEAA